MKVLIFAAIAATLVGCSSPSSSETPENERATAKLAESLEKWKAVKAASGSTYSYTANDMNPLMGTRSTTTVKVVDDRVTERSFEETDFDEAVIEQFAETAADLNQHPRGQRGFTLDEIYEKCRTEVFDEPDAEYSVAVHENGVLRSCLVTHPGMADDFGSGFVVSTLTF